MPLHRYSTALSYIVLSGICLYCLKSFGTRNGRGIPLLTYGVTLANSILGVWYWGRCTIKKLIKLALIQKTTTRCKTNLAFVLGNPLHGQNVEKPYKLTQILLTLFYLPLIVTDTWLRNGYKQEIAYAHAAVSLIPFVQYLVAKIKLNILDVIIALNVMSLIYISFVTENYFGITAAMSYAINHFVLAKERDLFNVPAEDVYNYGLCFFAYFSLRTITT